MYCPKEPWTTKKKSLDSLKKLKTQNIFSSDNGHDIHCYSPSKDVAMRNSTKLMWSKSKTNTLETVKFRCPNINGFSKVNLLMQPSYSCSFGQFGRLKGHDLALKPPADQLETVISAGRSTRFSLYVPGNMRNSHYSVPLGTILGAVLAFG